MNPWFELPNFLLGFQRRVLFLLNDLKAELQSMKRGKCTEEENSSVLQAETLEEFREMEEKLKSRRKGKKW